MSNATYQGVIRFLDFQKKSAIVKSCIYADSHPTYKLVYIKGNFSAYSRGDVIKYQYVANSNNAITVVIVA